ncbi:MAG: aminoacetone oxidase family FAD-binding enzyme [Kiritimatiellales bacterium]|nr:aminoacetone oxidase family FAD-binding enzyme [Kiritimatiellales bacterium]
MEKFDVIVVGGGPAGMMAAGRAAECGRRVLLVEKNRAFGEKLNLTGGGRCNITNAEFDTRTFLSFFGDARKFLFSTFSRFAVQETFDFFEGRGLPLVVEERKRAFPQTQQATDVTRVLTEYLHENGVETRMGATVKHLIVEDGTITGIETNQGPVLAESIILATGGASYKETGSTGDGLNWLREIGHTVHAATPDIVPLRAKEQWVKDLSGTTLEPMKITFTATTGEQLSKAGKILFTHFGISGPLILNSANEVKKLLKHGPVAATIDLFPGMEPHVVDRRVLEVFDDNKNKIVRNVAKQLAPVGMARAFDGHLPAELLDKKVNVVTQDERKTLVQVLKGLPLTITGTMGYDWAVVCDGGIDMAEIDTRTMRSRLYPNLYVAGDLLHISRPSGGYSLQLCWTTGWVAGENA